LMTYPEADLASNF